MMATIQKFVDQSISTNLSYNPQHYPDGKIPMSVMLRDLLLCNKFGIKTLYYHNTRDGRDDDLQDHSEAKPLELVIDNDNNPFENQEAFDELLDDEECDACTI